MSLLLLVLYLGAQIALGLWLARRVHSESDFFVAGRKLGLPLVAFSLFATWFGAETCLGSSGAVYESGLSGGRADPFGYATCLLLLGTILATKLWRGGFMTLGDVYRQRFGAGVERLAVLVLVPSSLIWAAAQLRAFGQVIAATTSLDVELALYLSAAFVIGYTWFGGLLGDVWTDVIQGSILAVTLVVMLGVAIAAVGGPVSAIEQVEPQRWSLLPRDESPWEQLDRWSIPIFGSLVAQELIARVVSAKSEHTARNGSLLACGLYLVVGACPVLLGLLGPQLVPDLSDPEQLLPELAGKLLPRFWYVVFSCALISAILSTIDSVLLAASALLSHNLIVPVFRVKEERARLLWARALVVASGLFALVVAFHAEGVYQLVETASAFGTAGVLVTTLAGLFLPYGTARGATLALLAGLVTTPLVEYGLGWPAPFLCSVLAAALVYLVVSHPALSRKARRTPPEAT